MHADTAHPAAIVMFWRLFSFFVVVLIVYFILDLVEGSSRFYYQTDCSAYQLECEVPNWIVTLHVGLLRGGCQVVGRGAEVAGWRGVGNGCCPSSGF